MTISWGETCFHEKDGKHVYNRIRKKCFFTNSESRYYFLLDSYFTLPLPRYQYNNYHSNLYG